MALPRPSEASRALRTIGGYYSTHCLLYILPLLLLFNYIPFTHAQRNVSVDDWESSIAYSPPGAWSMTANTSLNFGGAHMLTQNPTATAVFNFTGIAIYFISPLWPYHVTTAVSLDSGPITLIDLVDHSSPNIGTGPESVPFRVVWSATGLDDTTHSLRISVGRGEPYGIVDGLIYTINSPVPSPALPSSSSATIMTGRVVASSTANAAGTPGDEPSKSKSVVAVTLGIILGILGLLVIVAFIWYFCRRRRRPLSEAWTIGSASLPSPGGNKARRKFRWSYPQRTKPAQGPNAPGYYMSQSSTHDWHNPHYNYVGMPPPPLPAEYQHYSNQYHDQQYQYYAQNGTIQPIAPSYSRGAIRYVPGYRLSTITEKSTPQMTENRSQLAPTPATVLSELASSTYGSGGGSFYGGDRTSANLNAIASVTSFERGDGQRPVRKSSSSLRQAVLKEWENEKEKEKEDIGETVEAKARKPRSHMRFGSSRAPPDAPSLWR